jgi:hypothetical protein
MKICPVVLNLLLADMAKKIGACLQLLNIRLQLLFKTFCYKVKVKGKAIPVQAMEAHRAVRCRGSYIFLDNRPTDGSEVVSHMHQPADLYPHEDSWYSFLLKAESIRGP